MRLPCDFLVEAFRAITYIHVVPQTLENRVEELEKQVAELTGRTNTSGRTKYPWRTYCVFRDDADFEEAIRLGRKYREQQTFEKELAGS